MRRAFVVLALLHAVLSAAPAAAAELVMFRRAGCIWCQAWDRDVGPIYGRSEIGRRAPLRMTDIGAERSKPAASLKGPILYTPTFVLLEQEREIGRIEGYPGEDFFWGLLERLVEQLPAPRRNDFSAAPSDTSQR